MSTITWIQQNAPSPDTVQELSEQLRNKEAFPPVLAAILIQRGITTFDQARAFFRPDVSELHDPFLMKDMAKAVDRLLAARRKQEKVLLFGDYDVDGTSSVALLLLALRELGWEVEYYIPDRYQEGYGISYQGIEVAERAGVSLIISLDCGIKAIEKARFASQKGIDLIICDHHTPGKTLPDAVAILDPKRKDCPYPFKELTGCGVGMKLLQALRQRLAESEELDFDPMQSFGDLLVLSIACDIVPIVGENRVLAAMGLDKLRENPLPGIRALMDQAKDGRRWDISDLVFFLGPRINAAGRLEHASQAVEVLVGEGPQVEELAESLHQSNEARKELDQSMTESALAQIASEPGGLKKSSTVLYNSDWHKGIIGIVASRVIETHFRPTILLTQSEETLVGSARSVPGFDLYQALDACSEHLLQWGGHKYAAGLSLKQEDFPAFRDHFEQVVSSTILPDQRTPQLHIDHQVHFRELTDRFIRIMNRMAPFGPGNRRPIFQSSGVQVWHVKVLKETHLKLTLGQEDMLMEAIGFGLAEKWEQLLGGSEFIPGRDFFDIAFQPIFNIWNQKTTINLRLKDIRFAHA